MGLAGRAETRAHNVSLDLALYEDGTRLRKLAKAFRSTYFPDRGAFYGDIAGGAIANLDESLLSLSGCEHRHQLSKRLATETARLRDRNAQSATQCVHPLET